MVVIRGCLLQEAGAVSHFMLVQGEMHDTVAELKEFFTRNAVALVLMNGILNRLPGETVFQFKHGDRGPLMKRAMSRASCVSSRL